MAIETEKFLTQHSHSACGRRSILLQALCSYLRAESFINSEVRLAGYYYNK